jgi:hypothetical protein
MTKRNILLIIIAFAVLILIYQLSDSFAYTEGYSGNNIITGRDWGINITDIEEANIVGEATLLKDISSIATTMNINVLLRKPGDEISFNFTITNTSKLNGELYAITQQGLNNIDSEYINYTVIPVDYVELHTDDKEGSLIKRGDKQTFKVTIKYLDVPNPKDVNLSLGTTIIYKQK